MLKITITSTELVTTMDGMPVRLWKGLTERGISCEVFVHRIAVERGRDDSELFAELRECLPQARHVALDSILAEKPRQ
jgi:hypothetical protein